MLAAERVLANERVWVLVAVSVVKLVGWAVATPTQPDEHGVGCGTLIIGSARHPIVFDRRDRSLLGIARTIEDKLACDENPLSAPVTDPARGASAAARRKARQGARQAIVTAVS